MCSTMASIRLTYISYKWLCVEFSSDPKTYLIFYNRIKIIASSFNQVHFNGKCIKIDKMDMSNKVSRQYLKSSYMTPITF